MKTIGIIGALEIEIEPLKKNVETISVKQITGVEFYIGKMAGKSVVVSHSRSGKVNAAICTQVLIDIFSVDCIISTGAAGSISKDMQIGDIVVTKDTVHHDYDSRAYGDELGVNSSINESFFKADEELIEIAVEKIAEMFEKKRFFTGRIATGDQFITNHLEKEKIWNDFKALAIDMEMASIAQTCYLNGIPFVGIRTISDLADGDAISDFEKFLKTASGESAILVEEIVKSL